MVKTAAQISCMTESGDLLRYRKERVGRILVEDFYHASWESRFDTWVGQSGLLLLSDPSRKTYHSGNAQDRFLFLPGEVVPRHPLPAEFEHGMLEEGRTRGAGESYPAETFTATAVGNHHPAMLTCPAGRVGKSHPA